MVIIQTFSLKLEKGKEIKRNGFVIIDEPSGRALEQTREGAPDAKIIALFSKSLPIDFVEGLLKGGTADEIVVVSF